MRVAVIGASGFVGSTLVERLLSRGDDVVPFIHTSGNALRLARRKLTLPMLDLLDPHQVEAALKGVTHVVNCSRGGDEVMLTGLRNLLAAARKHRVERFVHLSSVAVYGDPPPPESTRENAPTRPANGTYGAVKLKQDGMVAAAAASGLPSAILCPPNIAGPYSFFLVALVDALRAGRFALLDGDAPCSLIDVSNLCHAIELALTNGPGDATRMFVTDDENTTWRSVIDNLLPLVGSVRTVPRVSKEQLAGVGGRPTKQISITKALKHLVSSEVREAFRKDPLWEKVDIALRRTVARLGKQREDALRLSVEGPLKVPTIAPPFDAVLCRQQLRGVVHSCELAKEKIGYKPLFSVEDSMEAFRNWYRIEHGMNTPAWPLLEQLY